MRVIMTVDVLSDILRVLDILSYFYSTDTLDHFVKQECFGPYLFIISDPTLANS